MLSSLLLMSIACSAGADRLLSTQVIFRHGDRTPSKTYPKDPYQLEFWGLPWGSLTTRGMEQHYKQGLRLKRMYIDSGLVNATYRPEEISIVSGDGERCIQSCAANLAGFYSQSDFHPTDLGGWPGQWTPLPIHTLPRDTDYMLEGGDCKRKKILIDKRYANAKFIEYVASKAGLVEEISKGTGESVKDMISASGMFDALFIEKYYYNLSIPWLTDELFQELADFEFTIYDYQQGQAGFGEKEDHELIRLSGGSMLKEVIGNLEGSKQNHGPKIRYYSGHDYSVTFFLYTLDGPKEAILGKSRPDYAATVAIELWEGEDGKFYVKLLYSKNASSEFEVYTKSIKGCGEDDLCLLDTFIQNTQRYVPKDIKQECNLF